VLHPVEAAAQHEEGHAHRRDRHAQVAADAEQLEAGGDAGELGAGGAEVGQHQRDQRDRGQPHAEPLTNQPDHPPGR
jgi:hypothetical protein